MIRTLSSLVAVAVIALCAASAAARTTGEPGAAAAQPLPDGRAGSRYAYTFTAEGGLAPLRWRVVSGALPPGVILTPEGVLSGEPAAERPGDYAFDVEVSDSSPQPQTAVQHCAVTIAPAQLRIVSGVRQLHVTSLAPPVPSAPTAPPASANVTGAPTAANGEDAKPSSRATFVVVDRKELVYQGSKVQGKTDPGVALEVYVHHDPDVAGSPVAVVTAEGDGTYAATLTNPLLEGDYITVRATGAEATVVQVREGPVGQIPGQSDLYDWGRVRAYFSAGVVFSKENESFSKNDVGLAFDLDKNWLWVGDPEEYRKDHSEKDPSQKDHSKKDYPFKNRFAFNTYFDTRLTSIPVAAMTPTDPPASGSDMSNMPSTSLRRLGLHRRGGDGGTGGTPAPNEDMGEDADATFLASRKAAYFEGGAYLPIGLTNWRHDGSTNQLFLAPIGKIGFSTITNEETTVEAEIFKHDDVYHFYGGGVRFGHWKLSNDRNVAPEIISYLDVVRGKWENFEGRDEDMNPVPGSGRWAVEGRLHIPLTPFIVGFNANLGDGPDDVRYVFGTRFDVGSLLAKIKGLR